MADESIPVAQAPSTADYMAQRVRELESQLANRNREAAQVAEERRASAARTALNESLSAYSFINDDAKSQTTALLEKDVVVDASGVRSTDGRSVAEYVADRVKASFQHMIKAPHNGGVGEQGGGRSLPTPSANPSAYKFSFDGRPIDPSLNRPLNFGEAALLETQRMRESGSAAASKALPAALNPQLGMGGFKGNASNHPDFRG